MVKTDQLIQNYKEDQRQKCTDVNYKAKMYLKITRYLENLHIFGNSEEGIIFLKWMRSILLVKRFRRHELRRDGFCVIRFFLLCSVLIVDSNRYRKVIEYLLQNII